MNDSPERVILRYWDKMEAQVGDIVLVDEQRRGVVTDVVDTAEKMRNWNVNEYGLMVAEISEAAVLFYLPERFLHDYPVDLISRPVA